MTGRQIGLVILVIVALWVLTAWISPTPLWIKDLRGSLPKHPTKKYDRRQLAAIQQVIIHHTTGPITQTPKTVANYHIGPNHISNEGIPGIAYHFIIDRAANVFQTNDLETISWHVSGQNTRSIGVCFIGDYDELAPTTKQMLQLIKLIRYLNRKLGKILDIAGHRDYASKSCPGDLVDTDWIRQQI